MTAKWEQIIESISYVNPETIDKEKIKGVLKYGRMHDTQVIDNLYLLKVLTIDEYKAELSRCIDIMKDHIKWAGERLKDAEKRGEQYNPLIYYGFGRAYMGGGIEGEWHKPDESETNDA